VVTVARRSPKPPKQRAAVGRLGKALTRRSGARCELCAGQQGLLAYELAPFPEEPELERALLACARCRGWLERGGVAPLEARFLDEAIWSELVPVRLAAVRLLADLDMLDDPLVAQALELHRIDPHTLETSPEEA
jgi:protein PhnA